MGEFVEAGLAEEAANRGDAGVVLAGPGGGLVCAGLFVIGMTHGAELEDVEFFAANRDAALAEDRGAGAAELDEGDDQEHGQGEENQRGERADDIDRAFNDARDAGHGALADAQDGHAFELVDGHGERGVARGDVGDDADVEGELLEALDELRDQRGAGVGDGEVDGVDGAAIEDVLEFGDGAQDGTVQDGGVRRSGVLGAFDFVVGDEVRDVQARPGVAVQRAAGDAAQAAGADDGDVAEVLAAAAELAEDGAKGGAFDGEEEGQEGGEADELELGGVETNAEVGGHAFRIVATHDVGAESPEEDDQGDDGGDAGVEDRAGLGEHALVAPGTVEAEDAEAGEGDREGEDEEGLLDPLADAGGPDKGGEAAVDLMAAEGPGAEAGGDDDKCVGEGEEEDEELLALLEHWWGAA